MGKILVYGKNPRLWEKISFMKKCLVKIIIRNSPQAFYERASYIRIFIKVNIFSSPFFFPLIIGFAILRRKTTGVSRSRKRTRWRISTPTRCTTFGWRRGASGARGRRPRRFTSGPNSTVSESAGSGSRTHWCPGGRKRSNVPLPATPWPSGGKSDAGGWLCMHVVVLK